MVIKLIEKFKKLSIKLKITILFFLINFAILLLFSGFILLRSYFIIYGTIDRNLENVSNELIKALKKGQLPEEIKFIGNKYWIKIYDKDKNVIYSSALAKKIRKIPDFLPHFRKSRKFSYDIRLKGKEYTFLSPDRYGHVEFRVHVKKFRRGFIQIAYPIEQTEESFQNLLAIVAWGIGIFIFLILIIGYYFSYKTLSPINEIIKQANFISEKNLNIRLPVYNKDEIGKLCETLNNLFVRLEKSFKEQKDFSSNVSHELKTPLSMIKLSLENILNMRSVNDEVKIEVEKVISNIQRLQNLISKLLLLSKLDYMNENPEAVSKFKKINLKEILNETLQEFEEYFKTKNLEIEKYISEGDFYIKGDKELIEKLFFNLFLNAYNFTPENEKVEVKLVKEQNKIKFSIKNTGTGIPEEKLNKIFKRFYRLDESRSSDTGGTGLGLAICKEIVKLHNGKIKVESKFQEYTKFIILFNVI